MRANFLNDSHKTVQESHLTKKDSLCSMLHLPRNKFQGIFNVLLGEKLQLPPVRYMSTSG